MNKKLGVSRAPKNLGGSKKIILINAALEERRTRGDMIQTWKIIHGVDNVDKKTWFKMVDGDEALHRTRAAGNQLNIVKPKCKNDLRRNFFSVRVVEKWNSLSNRVREAKTLNSFKNLYDEWLEETRRLQ